MAPLAARRLAEMVELGTRIVAIELMLAAQACDLRGTGARRRHRAGARARALGGAVHAGGRPAARGRASRRARPNGSDRRMLTFDVHQHLWPAAFVAALQARSAVPFLRGGELVTPEGTFAVDLRSHDPEQRDCAARPRRDRRRGPLAPAEPGDRGTRGSRTRRARAVLAGCDPAERGRGRRPVHAFAPWRVTAGFAGTSVGASALVDGSPGAALLSQVEASGGVLYVHPESAGPVPAGHPDWWNWAAGYTGQMQRAYLAWLAGGRERLPSLRIVFAMLAGGAPFHPSDSSTGASTSAMRSIRIPCSHGQLRPARDRALHRDLWRGGPRVRERHTRRRLRPPWGPSAVSAILSPKSSRPRHQPRCSPQ